MKQHSEPRPVGSYEVQRGWAATHLTNTTTYYNEQVRLVVEETQRDYPDLVWCDTRKEVVLDGAGATHVNAYVTFRPRVPHSASPLNPRNLNDAPPPNLGASPSEELGIGRRERKF